MAKMFACCAASGCDEVRRLATNRAWQANLLARRLPGQILCRTGMLLNEKSCTFIKHWTPTTAKRDRNLQSEQAAAGLAEPFINGSLTFPPATSNSEPGRSSLGPHPNPLEFELMTPPNHRSQLLSLLARTSFRLGQFKLSSGGTSDYYIDCRTTTLHAEGGRLTGLAVLELLEQNGIRADAVGGLTMGADPIVSNVATASAGRAQSQT